MANKKSKKNIKKTHRNNYRYKRKLITRNTLVKQKSGRGTRKIQNVLSGGGLNLVGIGRGIGRGSYFIGRTIAHNLFLLGKEIGGLLVFLHYTLQADLIMIVYICLTVLLIGLLLVPSIINDGFYEDTALPIHRGVEDVLLKYDPMAEAEKMWIRLEDWDPFLKKGGNTSQGSSSGSRLIKTIQPLLSKIYSLELTLGNPLSTKLREIVLQQVVTNPTKVSYTLGALIHGNGNQVTLSNLQEQLKTHTNGRVLSSTTIDTVNRVLPSIQSILQNESKENESKKINRVRGYFCLLVASLFMKENPKKQTAQEKNNFLKFLFRTNYKIQTINVDSIKIDPSEASDLNTLLSSEEFTQITKSQLTDGGPDRGPDGGPDRGPDGGPDEGPDEGLERDLTSIPLKQFEFNPQFDPQFDPQFEQRDPYKPTSAD